MPAPKFVTDPPVNTTVVPELALQMNVEPAVQAAWLTCTMAPKTKKMWKRMSVDLKNASRG